MLNAATEFKKNSFNEKDSAQLAEIAAKFTNIADTEISTADAASFLISQMKAFNIEAKDSEHIIDAVNEVANNFAVGTGDLSTALIKAGTSLGSVGNSFEETIGLVTAGTEILVGQPSKVGNGLRTIGLNIASLAKESENYVTANGAVNISLRDSQGEMRSTYDILKDLYTGVEGQSIAWKDLSNTQKAAIGETLAGKNQYNVLTSVMQNFESAIKAVETATDSQGSAAKENAVYMESLEAKVANLKNEFQELAVDFLDSKTISAAIDGISKFISFLDTDLGLAISKIGLFGGVLGGAVHIYGGIIGKLLGIGKGFVDLFKKATKAGEAVKKTAEAASVAAEVADTVGDVIGGKKSKVKKAASETAEAAAEMVGAAAEIGEAGAEIAKGAGKTADVAGDAAKVAGKASKAGAEVADTVGDVAGAAGGLSPIFSKLSGVVSKVGGAFGGVVGKVLPVVGGIAALGVVAKSAYKEIKNSNPVTALDDDLAALHSKESYLESTIQKLKEMGVGVDSNALQNFNSQLADTKKRIDELDEKKIQALFGTSELESHAELKGTGYDRRGETTIAFSDKAKVQELTDEYNNLVIAMREAENGPNPEKVEKYAEKVATKQEELFDLWNKLVEARQRNFEITPEMSAFGTWMEKEFGLNLEEAVYGTNSISDQLNKMAQLKPSFEQLGVAMGQIGQEGTDNYQILEQLNTAFQGVDGWEERMNSFYDSLQSGDVEGFTNEVRDFALEMVTSSMGVENFTEANSELLAKALETTGAFGDYEETLSFVEKTQKAVNDAVSVGIEGHTEQAVAALYATGLFESEGEALDYLNQKRSEVNDNPVNTDESTSELNEEKNAAQGAKDGLDKTKQGQDGVTNNPVSTDPSVSELNEEEGAASDTVYQLERTADGQMTVSNTPINTGQQQGALNALKRAAQGVVGALQSAWNWFQKVSGLKFGPGVGQSFSTDGYGRPIGGGGGGGKGGYKNTFTSLTGDSLVNPWPAAQGRSIEETGSYWVGEQGPEIVVLPRGSEVVSNKDIRRNTGLKIDKTSFDNNEELLPKEELLQEEQEELSVSNRGFAQGTINPHNNTGLPSNPIHRVVKKQITTLFTNLTDYSKQVNNYYNIAAKGAKKVVELAEKENEELEKQIKLFDAQTDIIEHKLFLLEKNGATEKEQIQLLQKMQAEVAKKADDYRKQGYDNESEVIRNLQKQWWSYQDDILDLQQEAFDERLKRSEQYIEDRNYYNDWGADSEIDAWKRVMDWMDEWYKKGLIDYEYYLDQREDAFHNYEEALREAWEEEADNIEKALGYVAKKAQDEIDNLEKERDKINKKYDEQIDALKKKNDETEREIELQKKLEELAKAKQKRVLVYKNGKFQYVQDVDEVAKAQAQLTEFQNKQKLDKEIEDLEKSRDEELKLLDEKIKYWEDYVKKYGDAIDKVKDEQDRLLAEQTLGIHLEGENWEKRLGNLQTYVDRYIELMQKLENQKWETGFGEDLGTGEGPGSESGSAGDFDVGEVGTAWVPGKGVIKVETINGETKTPLPVGSIVSTAGGDFMITGGTPGNYESIKMPDRSWIDSITGPTSKPNYGIGTSPNVTEGTSKTVFSVNGKAPPGLNVGDRVVTGAGGTWEITRVNPDGSYESKKVSDKNKGDYGGKLARGSLSAPGGMTLVGEEGPELRLLNHGDTIFPTHTTKNLMALGQFDWSNVSQLKGVGKTQDNDGNTYITIQNFNPNLPNVKDGEDFAAYMKNNFWQNVIQYQGKR